MMLSKEVAAKKKAVEAKRKAAAKEEAKDPAKRKTKVEAWFADKVCCLQCGFPYLTIGKK